MRLVLNININVSFMSKLREELYLESTACRLFKLHHPNCTAITYPDSQTMIRVLYRQSEGSIIRRSDSPTAYRLSSLPVNLFNKTVQ